MATHSTAIRLLAPDGTTVDGTVKIDGGGWALWLWIVGPDQKWLGKGPHTFGALLDARRALEADGWRILVYGASRNVWPSKMAIEFSGGTKAYRLELGRQVTPASIVRVLDYGDDIEPATIQEQTAFYGEWLRRARRRRRSEHP